MTTGDRVSPLETGLADDQDRITRMEGVGFGIFANPSPCSGVIPLHLIPTRQFSDFNVKLGNLASTVPVSDLLRSH